MSNPDRSRLSWVFAALVGVSAVALLHATAPVGATDDHDRVRALRHSGDIIPLADLLNRGELSGMRVLEAELEDEDGRLIYELELLDQDGRVHKREFDAASGKPLDNRGAD